MPGAERQTDRPDADAARGGTPAPDTVLGNIPPGGIAVTEGDPLAGDYVLICEHASNFIPPPLANLGLDTGDLGAHIAWDIGALDLARELSHRLGCGLIRAAVSRLVIDLNRPEGAIDLIPQVSETTPVPGNRDLDRAAIQARVSACYTPFHNRLREVFDARVRAGRPTHIISVHSFTPNYKGQDRSWHAGIIHDGKSDFAPRLLARLRGEPGLIVGENQPYTPADRVYHTLSVHGDARGLPTAMIEVRNDCLGNRRDIGAWADRLAGAISKAGDKGEARREAV
ncbi:hypothetical protein MNBD_ALPHA09-1409 [hydrothermal vent metagenome]|uniref:N-formylglutamate deformylase n=1 Tax=hydrothermal vent metagenome TaxID=652676 RepID=A0A3B0T825_9ZZZZ